MSWHIYVQHISNMSLWPEILLGFGYALIDSRLCAHMTKESSRHTLQMLARISGVAKLSPPCSAIEAGKTCCSLQVIHWNQTCQHSDIISGDVMLWLWIYLRQSGFVTLSCKSITCRLLQQHYTGWFCGSNWRSDPQAKLEWKQTWAEVPLWP